MGEDGWVTLADAARAVDRSTATIRRWVRAGKLDRRDGPIPEHGGTPPALVRLDQVHTLAVVDGIAVDPPRRGSSTTEQRLDGDAVADLRVAVAEARGEAARWQAVAEARGEAVDRLRADLVDAREERDRWREVAAAREAELGAMRAAGGGWWRRLIGG